uniref:NADH dehydrogenase subunit 6 n=1 Tax=Typosyllis sp. patternB TaxID=1898411 RepID=A0A1C9UZD4_9ANNE|nr:NADH dehydrogenase subunit 6 [Typosyllis sp. patternB]
MMLKLTPLIIISLSTTLSMITNPLSLGVYIMFMTILMAMLMSMMSTSWLGMAMFLIYIGGLLVLFSYFLAIQPNQFIMMSTFMLTSLISFLLITSNMNKFYSSQLINFSYATPSIPFIMINANLSFIIILTALLLLILVVVVKITTSKSGPLRPFY